LKATLDVLKDQNSGLLEAIKEIEKAYENEDWKRIDYMLLNLPERIWIE
jgi:hypothetical protein